MIYFITTLYSTPTFLKIFKSKPIYSIVSDEDESPGPVSFARLRSIIIWFKVKAKTKQTPANVVKSKNFAFFFNYVIFHWNVMQLWRRENSLKFDHRIEQFGAWKGSKTA